MLKTNSEKFPQTVLFSGFWLYLFGFFDSIIFCLKNSAPNSQILVLDFFNISGHWRHPWGCKNSGVKVIMNRNSWIFRVQKIDKWVLASQRMVKLYKKLFIDSNIDSKLTKCAVIETIPAFLTGTISKISVARSFFITMAFI